MENGKKLKLISILKLIGIKSISEIKEAKYVGMDDKSFELRLRVQKIMFFLSKTKLDRDLDYLYSIYLRGPYSPALAKDYFSITDNEFNHTENVVDMEPKLKKFVEYLSKKDNLWLEIASTLKSLIDDGGYNNEEAIDRVMELKDSILKAKNKDYSYVKKVFEEMMELHV